MDRNWYWVVMIFLAGCLPVDEKSKTKEDPLPKLASEKEISVYIAAKDESATNGFKLLFGVDNRIDHVVLCPGNRPNCRTGQRGYYKSKLAQTDGDNKKLRKILKVDESVAITNGTNLLVYGRDDRGRNLFESPRQVRFTEKKPDDNPGTGSQGDITSFPLARTQVEKSCAGAGCHNVSGSGQGRQTTFGLNEGNLQQAKDKLIGRMLSTNESEVMPPPRAAARMSKAERDALVKYLRGL